MIEVDIKCPLLQVLLHQSLTLVITDLVSVSLYLMVSVKHAYILYYSVWLINVGH